MTPAEKATALAWHRRWYRHVRELPDGLTWAAVEQGPVTCSVIRARFDDPGTVADVWNFEDAPSAIAALNAWDGAPGTEPDGWVRSIRSTMPCRRRPGGDPAKQFFDLGDDTPWPT
jgi:hypothetical protein